MIECLFGGRVGSTPAVPQDTVVAANKIPPICNPGTRGILITLFLLFALTSARVFASTPAIRIQRQQKNRSRI
jgi:hypothetical protein